MFPFWVNNLALFDLRFGFLVKNSIYDQMFVEYGQNPVKLINKLSMFINLNLGLIRKLNDLFPNVLYNMPGSITQVLGFLFRRSWRV